MRRHRCTSIESIGPVLGIAAFVGLAVLAFLLFQQARDIRRLREWAGRAPERARRRPRRSRPRPRLARRGRGGGRRGRGCTASRPRAGFGAPAARLGGGSATASQRVDRRLPVDGRYLLVAAAVAVIAVGVVTSGFGLVGGSGGGGNGKHGQCRPKATVAVLNGTVGTGPRGDRSSRRSSSRPATSRAGDQRGFELRQTVVDVHRGSGPTRRSRWRTRSSRSWARRPSSR